MDSDGSFGCLVVDVRQLAPQPSTLILRGIVVNQEGHPDQAIHTSGKSAFLRSPFNTRLR
jgi:hypothetical protein